MSILEIKHLRMISAIAQTRNMTRAADMLFISQSALSQQLKDIETKLASPLFSRTAKKMLPTSTGKIILKTAEQVLETISDTELEIARMVSGDRGELKVGIQCVFCYKWLPGVMAKFQEKFPNIEFVIGNSDHMLEELETGQFDVVITGSSENGGPFVYLPLFEDQMVCIMAQSHPLTARSRLDYKDFNNEMLIAHAEKNKNKFYQNCLLPAGVKPKNYMIVSQPQAIIELVSSGFGIGVFPRWAVRSAIEAESIAARPITRNGIPITWSAAFLKRTEISIFQKEFIRLVSKLNPVGRKGA